MLEENGLTVEKATSEVERLINVMFDDQIKKKE